MGALLLVIDMQNVYQNGQPWACKRIEEAQNNIITLLESGKVKQVIFTKYMPAEHPVGKWQSYNTEYADINENPWMSEIIDGLIPYTEKWPVYEKSVYSSYVIEEVREQASKADCVLITGVVAECCVLSTVIGAIDAGDMVVYLEDAVAGADEQTEEATKRVVSCFPDFQCVVKRTKEFLMEQ